MTGDEVVASPPDEAATAARGSTARNILRTGLAYVALPLSALVTGPVLSRALGPVERGELAAVSAPLVFVAVLASVGLPEAVQYFTATRRAPLRQLLRVGALIGFATGVVTAGALAAIAPLLLHRAPHVIGLLQALTLTLPPVMAFAAVRAVAQGLHRFDLVARERWLAVGSRTALVVGLAVAGALTVTSAAWATALTWLAASVVLVAVLREPGTAVPPAPRLARAVLGYGSRLWVGTIAGILVLRLDQSLMTPLAGARELGFYAVAVSIAEAPLYGILAVKEVIFSAAADRADPAIVARASRIATAGLLVTAAIGAALAPVLVPLLFGGDFRPAVPMTYILLAAAVPSATGAVVSAGLLSQGRPVAVSVAQVAALAVNVVALVLLVPAHGGKGAAVAMLLSSLVVAGVMTVAFARRGGLRPADCLVPRRDDVRALRAAFSRRTARGGTQA